MTSIPLGLYARPSLTFIVALYLARGVQAAAASVVAGLMARETRRQLSELDRRSLSDIGVPLNGPRSLAVRQPWDTSNTGG